MQPVSLAELLACLELRPVGEDSSEGANLDIGYHRVFGGQILGQIIAAAAAAVPDKTVKSLSVLFPREGDATKPMHYRCTVHQRGRTFATVEVVGAQGGQGSGERVVAAAIVSLHAIEEGLHHSALPPQAGEPTGAAEQRLDMVPWAVRIVDDVHLEDRTAGPPVLTWWMRAEELPALLDRAPAGAGLARAAIDQALLAYATDLTLIGTALRPVEGFSQADSTVSLATAVTSHSIWFHQPFRIDEWLLVNQEAPVLAGGRAFGRGDVFSGSELVASFAQESMIRQLT